MTSAGWPQDRHVAAALAQNVSVVARAAGHWRLDLSAEPARHVDIRLECGWLGFRASLPLPANWREEPAVLGRVLEHNGRLAGPAKLVLSDGEDAVDARADLAVENEEELASRIRRTCAAVETAVSLGRAAITGASPAPLPTPCEPPLQGESADLDALLAAACGEAGWPFVQRGRVLQVELEVPDAAMRATLRADATRGILASVAIGGDDRFPTAASPSLALLLLRAARGVRMVRATIDSGGGSPRFEVGFGAVPTPAEINDALAALSVVCRASAREAAILRRDEVAGACWQHVVGSDQTKFGNHNGAVSSLSDAAAREEETDGTSSIDRAQRE